MLPAHKEVKSEVFQVAQVEPSQKNDVCEPNLVDEALRIPHWKEAMERVFEALIKNKTWILVPYNDNQRVVDCKWVFKTKYKASGKIERFKARLVTKEFQQDLELILVIRLVQWLN